MFIINTILNNFFSQEDEMIICPVVIRKTLNATIQSIVCDFT
jgi:hypothetical protein